MADNNPKKPIPPASTQRTTMVMVIILLAVAFFVGSQFMRTGAMGTTVTDQLITSEFTQAVEQGRVKSVTYSAGDYTVSGTYFPAATAGSEAAAAFNGAFDSLNALMATEHGDDGKVLIVISTFALDFIHSDRSIFKIVDLDEAWAFLNVAQGETLSNKLVRAGRAMQAGVYFVTQSAYDVSKESLKNNIGLKFAFRSTDINEIKQTLEFFGIDKDDENNQKRLRDLENGQCLLQDLYGRVGVVQIHPVFEELLHAFDTRPPVQRNEVE